jgi:hypothetical protein
MPSTNDMSPLKPSERAARELRAGLAYLLRLGERRAEAGLPPLRHVTTSRIGATGAIITKWLVPVLMPRGTFDGANVVV